MTGSMWRRSEAGIAEHPTVDGTLAILKVDAVGGIVEVGELTLRSSSGAEGAGSLAKPSEHFIFLSIHEPPVLFRTQRSVPLS
jgi:hypothetical protein